LIEENGVTVKSSKLPVLKVIPHQFNQLLLNIVGNSIKYRKKNADTIINIYAEIVNQNDIKTTEPLLSDRYWMITVTDNGIGFEQQYAKKIFELFQRLHNRTEYEGTGIGLSICKKIVQNHRGYIEAIGEPEVGSIFKIYIPYSG
jgi:signal transduction histidine kinase